MQAKQRKKRSWFFVTVFFMFLFIVPLEVGGLRELWYFLEEYQMSLPENVAAEGLAFFEDRDLETLSQFVEYTPHPLERGGSLNSWLEAYLGFDEENVEYTLIPKTGASNQKRYVVAKNSFKVAELQLTPTEQKTKRGFTLWELSNIDIASVSGHYGAEIILPHNVELTINGLPVDEVYMTENALPLDISGYRELGEGYQPTVLKYRVEGLLEPPEIAVHPKGGGHCVLERMDSGGDESIESYKVSLYGGQEFIDTAGVKAENAAKLYARFITKDAEFEALLPYLMKGGPLHNQLSGFYNAWYIDHDSYEFQDFQMKDFILYDESHFSCGVSFKYVIRMGRKVYEYPSAYTLYFVYGTDGWMLASLEIR